MGQSIIFRTVKTLAGERRTVLTWKMQAWCASVSVALIVRLSVLN